MKTKNTDLIKQNKIFAYLALTTGFMLFVPFFAMQFSGEMQWELSDFVIMGALIFGMGFIFVHVARLTPRKYRVLIGTGFFLLLLLIWAELAVGIFTNLGS